MDKPINLQRYKKDRLKRRGKETTLCARGFHKWVFDDKKQYDVKQGKLISVQRCSRCGKQRSHVQ